MAINTCAPCTDPCYRSAAPNSELSFRSAVIEILCSIYTAQNPDSSVLSRINGNYNGTEQVVVAGQAGKKIRVRSLVVGTEDANTDWRFLSKGAGAATAISPNLDYLNNAGAVLNDNPAGWFETIAGEGLVVTTSAPVDLLGTVQIIG